MLFQCSLQQKSESHAFMMNCSFNKKKLKKIQNPNYLTLKLKTNNFKLIRSIEL
jgi:hypothetical protein